MIVYCFDQLNLARVASIQFVISVGLPFALIVVSDVSAIVVGVLEPQQLMPRPTIAVTDSASNIISDPLALPSFATARYPTVEFIITSGTINKSVATTAALIGPDGTYSFVISARALFGDVFQILFSVPGLPSITTGRAKIEKCIPGSEYAEVNTFNCLACPEHAVCDGTDAIGALPGFWRGSVASIWLYQCTPPESCASSTQCSNEYTGTLCGSCSIGYGRSGTSCVACYNKVLSWFFILGLFVALLFVTTTLALAAFLSAQQQIAELLHHRRRHGEQGRPRRFNARQLSIVFKMVLSHLQMLAVVPVRNFLMPPWITQFLSVISAASSLNPNFSFISCELAPTILETMYVVLAVPPIVMVFLFGVFALRLFRMKSLVRRRQAATEASKRFRIDVRAAQDEEEVAVFGEVVSKVDVIHRRYDINQLGSVVKSDAARGALNHFVANESVDREDQLDRNQKELLGNDAAQVADVSFGASVNLVDDETQKHKSRREESTTKSYDDEFIENCALSVVIVLFLAYPSIVQACAKIRPCTTVVMSAQAGDVRSVMLYEPSIDCSSPTYSRALNAAAAFLVFITAGVPLATVGLVYAIARWTRRGDVSLAKQVFYFTTGGYRDRVWFWEVVGLLRKAALVIAVNSIVDSELQMLACFWITLFSVYLNFSVKPWINVVLLNCEYVSLIALTATYGSLAMYSTDSGQASRDTMIVPFVLFAANAVAFAYFAFAISYSLRSDLSQAMGRSQLAKDLYMLVFERWDMLDAEQRLASLQRKVSKLRYHLAARFPRHEMAHEVLRLAKKSFGQRASRVVHDILARRNAELDESLLRTSAMSSSVNQRAPNPLQGAESPLVRGKAIAASDVVHVFNSLRGSARAKESKVNTLLALDNIVNLCMIKSTEDLDSVWTLESRLFKAVVSSAKKRRSKLEQMIASAEEEKKRAAADVPEKKEHEAEAAMSTSTIGRRLTLLNQLQGPVRNFSTVVRKASSTTNENNQEENASNISPHPPSLANTAASMAAVSRAADRFFVQSEASQAASSAQSTDAIAAESTLGEPQAMTGPLQGIRRRRSRPSIAAPQNLEETSTVSTPSGAGDQVPAPSAEAPPQLRRRSSKVTIASSIAVTGESGAAPSSNNEPQSNSTKNYGTKPPSTLVESEALAEGRSGRNAETDASSAHTTEDQATTADPSHDADTTPAGGSAPPESSLASSRVSRRGSLIPNAPQPAMVTHGRRATRQ